jgi:ABC-type nitrate/sulfonate/bicarbonate transport system substrate-binding protein
VNALTLGFIPLTDCAPLIVAQANGHFADEGLDVTLSREASWATVRDKVAVGALDGAHMLAPMALGATAGARGAALGGTSQVVIAPLALAVNGAAITLSNRLVRALGEDVRSPLGAAAGIAQLVAAGRAAGDPPMTFAVVFPFSMHNYLLRYWLAGAGVDPDRDVRIVVVPPPRMVEQLALDEVDGFCVGAPWNAVAVDAGIGRIVLRSSHFWPAGPDKVLGVNETFATEDPARLQALLRAVVRAQAWADEPGHREQLTMLLAEPHHVGAAPNAIAVALSDELVFQRDGACVPRPEHARWMLGQMRRWKQIGPGVDTAALAAQVYRADLALEALKGAGIESQPPLAVAPLFDGKAFDA